MLPSCLKQLTVLLTVLMSASGLFMYNLNDYELLSAIDDSLPTQVTPSDYVLKLYPRISEGFFNGSVDIKFTCKEPTQTIVLHAHKSLDITHDKVLVSGNSLLDITRNSSTDKLTINLKEEVLAGDVYLEFGGSLKEAMRHHRSGNASEGFQRMSYDNTQTHKKSWYATLSTAPKQARTVFPCFDEPAFKTTFKISVARLSEMSTLSVMPRESTERAEEDGWVWDHFSRTPPLSTFSVNILVSELESDPPVNISTSLGNLTVQFHHHHQDILGSNLNGRNNSETVIQTIKQLQNFLEVDYPLPKLNFVAMPRFYYGFQQSSMGLIPYDEYILQYDYMYIVSELVDQWFNHMTTPDCWSGFNLTNMLALYITKGSLFNVTSKLDWFHLQHQELYNYFSQTSKYSHHKGMASLYSTFRGDWFLEMLNSTFSRKTLRKGIGRLIVDNMFGTINENKLWDVLTNQAQEDGKLPTTTPPTVRQLANSWLHNSPLVPVLTVMRNYQENSAYLEQHVFSQDRPRNLTEEEEGQRWWIPINYVTSDNLDPDSTCSATWMGEQDFNITNLPDEDSFIILNPTDSGMFLVNYDEQNWRLLSESLFHSGSKFHTTIRKTVLQDALLLAAGEELNYTSALNMTLFLFHETDYSVLAIFVSLFDNYSENLFQWTPIEDKFDAYVRRLLTPVFGSADRPDFHEYDDDYIMFWYNAKAKLQRVGYQPYINKTQERLNHQMPTFPFEDNDTKLIIFCPEFMKNSSDDWTKYITQLETYIHSVDYNQRHFWIKSMAKCPGYIDFMQNILNAILNEDSVFSTTNWKSIVNLLTNSPTSHAMTLNYFFEHFEAFKQKFYGISDIWTTFLSSLISKIRTYKDLNKLTHFYYKNMDKLGYSKTQVENEMKKVEVLILWDMANFQEIQDWFDNFLPNFMRDNDLI